MTSARAQYEFIDLATGLLPVIEENLSEPVDAQIAAWQEYYAQHAPDFPERLYADYADVDGGWMSIARERVWPHLGERIERMCLANDSIRAVHSGICERALRTLGFRDPLAIVSYVGLGNGAGWATSWEGAPAVLLGLENIAELNWHLQPQVRKLMAHEIGHLFMTSIRTDVGALTEDPLLALYEEGFAQHCEHVTLGSETWGCASQDGWLEWCLSHEEWLAGEYLQSLKDRDAWRRFFGSWFATCR